MENSAANTDLIRGHVITIILRSLESSDKYGYEICREIEVKSEGSYVLKQPTLYSCLKRLESQEYITSYWGEISNGGRRRYYSLTEKGRAYLEHDKQEWEFSRTLINRLLSDKDYDLTTPPPFNPSELRPYTRKMNEFGKVSETDESNNQFQTEASTTNISVSSDEVNTVEQTTNTTSTTETIDQYSVAETSEHIDHISETIQTVEEPIKNQTEEITHEKIKPQQLDIFDVIQEETEEEKSDVNYKNAFSKLFDAPQKDEQPMRQQTKSEIVEEKEHSSALPETISELKKNFYLEGFNLKPYSFSNVVIYYNMNYVYANKLNLLTYWLMYLILALEIGFIRLIFGTEFGLTNLLYILALVVGLIIPGVPTVMYLTEPLKRVKADFEFKTSIINRSLLALNLAFVFACMGVFVWQVNLQELSSMVLPIFVPIILLLNLPLSSCVYYQIYKTKKFHLT